jgi:hypothetical protein
VLLKSKSGDYGGWRSVNVSQDVVCHLEKVGKNPGANRSFEPLEEAVLNVFGESTKHVKQSKGGAAWAQDLPASRVSANGRLGLLSVCRVRREEPLSRRDRSGA